MAVKRKSVRAELKDADKGQVDLVFATFNVKDKDGDVTLPGAFEDGAKVAVSPYGHSSVVSQALPVGTATIRQNAKEARATAQYFMDTQHGLEAFTTIKNLYDQGVNVEWSYGYDPVKYDFGEWSDGSIVRYLHKQSAYEVSPVIRGAGEGTRIMNIKGEMVDVDAWSGAIKPHSTDVETKSWNDADEYANITSDASISDLFSMFAMVHPDLEPDSKTAYSMLHHKGANGPANVRACVLSIAKLNGLAGILDESRRKQAYDHLASHLKDAGREVPAYREVNHRGLTLNDELMDALRGVSSAIDSALRVGALRAGHGQKLSNVNSELAEWLLDDMKRLKSLFETPEESVAIAKIAAIKRQHNRR